MEKEISRCDKLEKGLNILFGGYFKKENSLLEHFTSAQKALTKRSLE
jgi:hypothetical protein